MQIRLFLPLKRYHAPCLYLAAGLALHLFATSWHPIQDSLETTAYLPRDSYGGADSRYDLTIDGLGGGETELHLPVQTRRYTDTEFTAAANHCMEKLPLVALSGNASPAETRGRFGFPVLFPEGGLPASYLSSGPVLLDSYDDVNNAALTGPAELILAVTLHGTSIREGLCFLLPLIILPPATDPAAQHTKDFFAYLQMEDNRQTIASEPSLPREYQGHTLRYHEEKRSEACLLLLLSAATMLLFPLKERRDGAGAAASRQRQFLLDYPELMSKFLVLLDARMNAHNTLLSIAVDRSVERQKKTAPRVTYEELKRILLLLCVDESGSHVHRAFGHTCGLR